MEVRKAKPRPVEKDKRGSRWRAVRTSEGVGRRELGVQGLSLGR